MSDPSTKRSLGTSPAVGKWAAHVQVNGAGQDGSRLIIHATKGDVFEFEDIFTISGVNDVDNGQLTGSRKRFMVLERMIAKGDHKDVLKIMPAIVGPGQKYANVDALPVDNAILEWLA